MSQEIDASLASNAAEPHAAQRRSHLLPGKKREVLLRTGAMMTADEVRKRLRVRSLSDAF